MDKCVFCRIARGELPAAIAYEDGDVLVLLDTKPLFEGHCLLVPKRHIETLEGLPLELVGPFFAAAQRLAAAVEAAMEAEGTFVALNNKVSQSVPHLHLHVVPRKKGDGLKGFFWPRTKYGSESRMSEVADLIAERMAANEKARASGRGPSE